MPEKTPAFAVVRYDDYLTEHATDVSHLVAVVKVLLDADAAEAEAARLNELNGDHSRYWVHATRLMTGDLGRPPGL